MAASGQWLGHKGALTFVAVTYFSEATANTKLISRVIAALLGYPVASVPSPFVCHCLQV